MKVAILGIFIALFAWSSICMADQPVATEVSGNFVCTPGFATSTSSIALPDAGPGACVQTSTPVVATISGECGSSASWTIQVETADGSGKMHTSTGAKPAAGFKVWAATPGWIDMSAVERPVILDHGTATASHSTDVYFGQCFDARDEPGTYTAQLNLVAVGTGF